MQGTISWRIYQGFYLDALSYTLVSVALYTMLYWSKNFFSFKFIIGAPLNATHIKSEKIWCVGSLQDDDHILPMKRCVWSHEVDDIIKCTHNDVIKRKHFLCYWPFVQEIHQSLVNSPHKGLWCEALMFSLICAWINCWVNNQDTGDLRCHHTHYDVIVMDKIQQDHSPHYQLPVQWSHLQSLRHECSREYWALIQKKLYHLNSIGNAIVEIRRSYDRLISTMVFPILVRQHLYIESGPWSHQNVAAQHLSVVEPLHIKLYAVPECMPTILHITLRPPLYMVKTLHWRHNEHDGISNHQRIGCFFKRLFRCRSKKISKLCVTGPWEANPPVTSGFPSQRASNAENISIWWNAFQISRWVCNPWLSAVRTFYLLYWKIRDILEF